MFTRQQRLRTFAEPIDDFGADEAFLQNVIAPPPVAPAPVAPAPVAAPAPPAWEPLAGQISSQWQQFGINPDIQGINRANELAQILTNYGITDLSKLGIKETPYEEMRGGYAGEGGDYAGELYKGNRGQLTYGDQTFGRLGGFGSKGQQEFSAPQEFLQEAGGGRYGLGYSAAGKGWVEYELATGPDGKPVIVPRWGSTSDIGEIAPLLTVASFIPGVAPFAQAINAGLAVSRGDVLGGIGSLAGLGGYTDVANAARLASAAKNEDLLGAIMPGLGLAGVSDVGGFSTKDIGKAVNVARAIEQENPLALAGAASAYLPGPSMPGLFVDENIQEGFFDEDGPGYIKPTTAPAPLFPEFDQPLLTADPTDWTALYAQPSDMSYMDPDGYYVHAEVPGGADQAGYPVQNFGVEPQSDINEVYNRIADDMGGFASTWQTVGSDRVMVQDDGSAIGINTETNQSFSLTPEETQRMIDAGLLNTAASGYEAAIRGTPSAPAAPAAPPAAAPAPAPAAKKKEDDLALLMMLSAMMTPQQKEEEQYQVAQILGIKDPFGRIV